MSSLEGVLASIPGLAGYSAQTQFNQQRDLSGLQQMGALQGILAKVKEQQLAEQFRGAMAAAKTPEEQAAVAAQFGSPKDIMGHADRQVTAANTREIALQRIDQASTQGEQMFKLRFAAAKDKKEQDAINNEYLAFNAKVKAAKAQYETGTNVSVPTFSAPLGPPPNALTPPPGTPAPAAAMPPQAAIAPQQATPAPGVRQTPMGRENTAAVGGLQVPVLQAEAQKFTDAGQPVPPELQQELANAKMRAGGQYPARVSAPPSVTGVEPPAAPSAPAAPNNLDTRDLRLQNAAPQGALAGILAQSAPPAAPTPSMAQPAAAPATKKPGEFSAADAPASMIVPKERAQWAAQQNKSPIAGNSLISPETATRFAEQALRGDLTGAAGWSRNPATRGQVENEITRLAAEQGKTGGDIVGQRANLGANKIALGAITKDLVAITPFKEMLDTNAKVAIDLGRKLADDKTNSAFINKPLIWLKNNMSNRPDVAEYLAQMHFIQVEAARVLTQPRLVGQLTDQAIKDLKSVLDGSMTIASTEAVINRIMADGNNRINAMRAQQQRTRSEISGVAPRTRETDKTGVDTTNPLLR